MGQLRTFYEAVQTKVEAILNGADPAFLRVYISPEVNLEWLARVPRFPVAIITEKGGVIDTVNGKIWTGAFDITIIDMKPRDHMNEAISLELMDLGDLLVAAGALEYNTDISIWMVAESKPDSVQLGSSFAIGKSYSFGYELERA